MAELVLSDDGDYVDDDNGFFQETETAATTVRHQVLGVLNAWVGDLNAGRVQRGIAGRNASEAEAELERESLIQSLRVLEVAGLIDSIEVTVEKVLPTRFAVGVSTRDTQSGGTIDVAQIIDFGP